MDLSKAFDAINQELLIAKSYTYGFWKDALKLIYSFVDDQRLINHLTLGLHLRREYYIDQF